MGITIAAANYTFVLASLDFLINVQYNGKIYVTSNNAYLIRKNCKNSGRVVRHLSSSVIVQHQACADLQRYRGIKRPCCLQKSINSVYYGQPKERSL